MASFSAGTTFTDGVANDVTAAKLGALVNNATPTSGLIQDRTAETATATNDTLLIGDASDSNNLKRITVANFAQTLPTAKITTGTIETGTFGTTTSTAPSVTGDLAIADKVVHSGDTNTAIRFPADDTVTIETAGSERVRVDSSGNVGIGTASPSSILHISKTGAAFPSSSNPRIRLDEVSSGRFGIIEFDSSTNLNIWGSDAGSGSIRFFNGTGSGTERLRIDSSGNVGIGTTNPAGKLDVVGGRSFFSAASEQYGIGVKYVSTGGAVYFGAASSSATPDAVISGAGGVALMTLQNGGNVGIGTTSPALKLHVDSSNPSNGMVSVFRNSASSSLTGSQIQITQNGVDDWAFGQPAGVSAFAFWSGRSAGVSGTERLRIGSAGQIGIGGANYGTSGQVLTSNGTGSAPSWQANTPADGTITYAKLSTSATEADNVSKRVAKAWVNFNGTGTVAIRDDFNVSSITDNNTGDYTINFSSNMSSANYAISGVCQASTSGRGAGISAYIVNATAAAQAPTTSSFRVGTVYQTNVAFDSAYVMINIFE